MAQKPKTSNKKTTTPAKAGKVDNPLNLPALWVRNTKTGVIAKQGYPVRAASRDNDHAAAAEGRAAGRFAAYTLAHKMRGGNAALVTAYPSNWEVRNSKADSFYRESLFDKDLERQLKVHRLSEDIQGKDIILVVNDVYVCDWKSLFDGLSRASPNGAFKMVYCGLTLSGTFGADYLGRELAGVWVKRRGKYHYLCANDSAARYRHVDNRPWKGFDKKSYRGYQLSYKAEKMVTSGRELCVITVTPDPAAIDIPRDLPSGGLIVQEGLVPRLFALNWTAAFRRRTDREVSLLMTAEREFEKLFPGVMGFSGVMFAGAKEPLTQPVMDALKATIERVELIMVYPKLAAVPRSEVQEEERLAERAGGGLIGEVVGVLGPRKTHLELSADVLRKARDKLAKLWAILKRKARNLVESLRELISEAGTTAASAAAEAAVLSPAHPLFHFQRGLLGLSKIIAKRAGVRAKGWNKLSAGLARAAAILGKPFSAESFFGLIGELLLTASVVVGERLISLFTRSWSDLAVTIFEIFCLLTSHEELDKWKLVQAIVLGLWHLLLALIPWWISLPVHLLGDLVLTGWFSRLFDWIVRKMATRGSFTAEVATSLARFREKLVSVRLWFHTKRGPRVESGVVTVSDVNDWSVTVSEPITSGVIPEAAIRELNEDSNVVVKMKVNGVKIPFSHENVNTVLEAVPESKLVAVPLVDVPALSGMGLTDGSPYVFLSALCNRYRVSRDFAGQNPNLRDLLREVLRGMGQVEPWTREQFLKHATDVAEYPATKVQAYENAFGEKFPWPTEAEQREWKHIAGKSRELLRWRQSPEGRWIKTRIVYPFMPSVHARHDTILAAHALKEAIIEYVNDRLFTSPNAPTFRMYVPKKANALELTEILNDWRAQSHAGMLSLIMGDDTYDVLRAAKALWTAAADLKSCDLSLRDKIEVVVSVLQEFGLSDEQARWLLECCSGKFRWEQRVKTAKSQHKDFTRTKLSEDVLHVVITVFIRYINGSGNAFTTLITILVSYGLKLSAYKAWNGDPRLWNRRQLAAANLLTVQLEIENHNRYLEEPVMHRMGIDSFLSCVPIDTPRGIVVIPRSPVKACLIKGERTQDKGLSIHAGMTVRAGLASLQATHYGRAIAGAMSRYLAGKPAVDGYKEPPNPYKVNFEGVDLREPLVTLEEELEYYCHYGPFSMEMLIGEIGVWENIVLPGCRPHMPILEAMAAGVYGLRAPAEC